MHRSRCDWLIGVLIVLGLPHASWGQSGVWTSPLSGTWSTPANWSGGTVANGAGNVADFSTLDIGADVTVTLDTARTIGTLLFGDTTPTNNWFISGGNTLTLQGGTPTVTVNNQSATIGSPINVASAGFTKNGNGTLNLTASSTSGGQTITVSAGTFNIAGAAFNLLSGGGNPNFIIGNGAVVSAANSANNAHNIGSVSLTGGTLTSNLVSDSGFGHFLLNGDVTVNASATQANITAGRVSLQTAGRAFNVADGAAAVDLFVSSQLFNGGLNKNGAGTMVATGANTFSVVNVNAGTYRMEGTAFNSLGGAPNVFIGDGATLSASNTANNAHNIGIVTLTGGTLTTSGAASDGGFGNFLLQGNVTTNASATQSNITATRVNLTATRTFTVAQGAAAIDLFVSSELFGGNVIKDGAGLMVLSGNNNYGTTTINAGTLSISNEINLGTGGAVTINGGTLQTTANFTIDDAARTITIGALGGTIETASGTTLSLAKAIASTAGDFFKSGAGTLDLTVNGSSFSGRTLNVSQGTMRVVGTTYNMLGFGQNIFIGEGAALVAANTNENAHNFNSLTLTGGTLTSSGAASDGGFGNFLLNGNVTTNASATQATISATRVNLQGTRTFTVANGAAATDLLVSSELFNGGIIKDGLGLMSLAGNNTYTGTTVINAGILSINAENRLGGNPGAFNAAQLAFNGGTLQTTASFIIDDANRGITVNAAGGTIETASGTTLTVARPIVSTAGVTGLTKTGAGTMDLTVTNNFTGSTLTVNDGTVNISAVQSLAGGSLVVTNGQVNLASVNTFNLLSGNPNIVIGGGGTVSAANTSANNAHNIGSVTFTGGTLTSNAVSDAGFGNWLINGNVTTNASATQATISATRVNLQGNPTFSVADGGAAIDLLVSSQLFGGDLTKAGAGLMRMTGGNNFDGRTLTVTAGTLEVGAVNSLSGGSVVVTGGTLSLNSASTFNLLGGNPNISISGSGVVTAANTVGNNAHNIGGVTFTGGTLSSNGVSDAGFGHWLLNGNVVTNASATQANITAGRVNLNGARTFTVANGAAPVDLLVSSQLFNGSLLKQGAGLMTLTGVNTYAGTTSVSQGTLNVDGTHSGAGSYTVSSGAALGGSGTINLAAGANVNVLPASGVVSPGAGYSGSNPASSANVGTLTINATSPASLALDMNGLLQIDIVSPVEYDVLNVANGIIDIDSTAVVSINGQTNLSQLNLGALGFDQGDRITFLLADQIVGNFANFPVNREISTAGGSVFFGNDGVSLYLAIVPEPASVAMWLLLGCVVATLIRRENWRRSR